MTYQFNEICEIEKKSIEKPKVKGDHQLNTS